MASLGISLLVLAVICFVIGFFARVFFFIALVALLIAFFSGMF